MAQTEALNKLDELLSDLSTRLLADGANFARTYGVLVELIVYIRTLLTILKSSDVVDKETDDDTD